MLPEFGNVGHFKVVNGKLQFLGQTDFAVGGHISSCGIARPDNVVDRINILQKCGDAFQAVGDLAGDGVKVDAAALLEVGELRDLKAIQHNLPADAPGAERGRLPVVFL